MGIFDTYGKQGVQLKVGDPSLQYYKEGDEVGIADGVYLGYEGAVVILDGKLARVFDYLKNKWGGKIKVKDIIDPVNPIKQALDALDLTSSSKIPDEVIVRPKPIRPKLRSENNAGYSNQRLKTERGKKAGADNQQKVRDRKKG
jgi:hypothetical protein